MFILIIKLGCVIGIKKLIALDILKENIYTIKIVVGNTPDCRQSFIVKSFNSSGNQDYEEVGGGGVTPPLKI